MADCAGVMMSAYHKFSDVLQNRIYEAVAPKPAKLPKVASSDPQQVITLGGFDALGGSPAETEKFSALEHDGKIPPEWTDGFLRLDPGRAPGDIPLKRWCRFVEDVDLFLRSPFCAVAAALGWRAHDLFGCDRERPFERIDQAGLLWLLNGDRLVMLTEHTATIESRTNVRQTWNRKPDKDGRVLAWELRP